MTVIAEAAEAVDERSSSANTVRIEVSLKEPAAIAAPVPDDFSTGKY